ncbi:MAG TPA: winged helix-turn-helix domain-containing protein [Mycobacterium sp.]|jgi:ArsR family transcriptional regulator|nr:winged helix-turn-helix domain-containing protein [Mycobacterium sp.]
MRNSEASVGVQRLLPTLKAVASPVRLEVLSLLKDPVGNFPPQTDGDLLADGVCADFIRDRLGIAPATASRHLTLLTEAGLLIATRKKGWTFYRRDESAIGRFAQAVEEQL